MKLQSILQNNVYNCFDRSGEFSPNDIALRAVADYLLENAEHPEEYWEGETETQAIKKACITMDFDDCMAMILLARKGVLAHAKQIIEEDEGMLTDMYYQQPVDTH